MTETEALAAIAALDLSAHDAEQVRAVLARVGSGAVPPQHIDRDALLAEVAGISNDYQTAKALSGGKATDLLDDMAHRCMAYLKTLLDQEQEVLALVRPVPPHDIDRDAIAKEVFRWLALTPPVDGQRDITPLVDRLAALWRIEAVTLTPGEDLDRVIAGLRMAAAIVPDPEPWDALAEKLETMAQGGQ